MAWLASKVGRATATVFIALVFTFCMLRFSGDPAISFLGVDAPPEALEAFRNRFGLDQPFWTQFVLYLRNLAQGDFGLSLRDGRPVTEVVFEAVPKTLQLMSLGFALSLIAGIPAGVYAAAHRGKLVDRMVMAVSVLGFSVPNFFLGLLLILVFTLWLRLLPPGGSSSPVHFIMPIITLATSYVGIIARYARASMVGTLDKPFVLAARARGFAADDAIWRHAVPNAAIPMVTVCGLIFGSLLGGAAVIETVFAWPGMGRLLVQSVLSRDLPVVQFIVIMLIFIMVLTNLFVDYLYTLLDPRVHFGSGRTRGEAAK